MARGCAPKSSTRGADASGESLVVEDAHSLVWIGQPRDGLRDGSRRLLLVEARIDEREHRQLEREYHRHRDDDR